MPDLGATITGPKADLNLGLTTLLDGATTTELTLDTSVPGTHKIEYTGTDPKGLTGSATRTVIVSAANDNPQPQSEEQSSHDGNSPIVQPSATGTDATTSTTSATSSIRELSRSRRSRTKPSQFSVRKQTVGFYKLLSSSHRVPILTALRLHHQEVTKTARQTFWVGTSSRPCGHHILARVRPMMV